MLRPSKIATDSWVLLPTSMQKCSIGSKSADVLDTVISCSFFCLIILLEYSSPASPLETVSCLHSVFGDTNSASHSVLMQPHLHLHTLTFVGHFAVTVVVLARSVPDMLGLKSILFSFYQKTCFQYLLGNLGN